MKMATNVTYSASYLAQSKATLLNTFYSIPIALELISTAIRIWAKLDRRAVAPMGFDDYLMLFATVSLATLVASIPFYFCPAEK
jgi:hypothetical protein